MRPHTAWALLPAFLAALLLQGCARRVPVAELGTRGAEVGVRVVLDSGERFEGRLVSLSKETLVADIVYREGPDVEFAGTGERFRVIAAGSPVAGEVLSVEGRGREKRATVRLTLPLDGVAEATFHQSAREATLGPVVSALLGPLVGASLALLF